MSQNFADLIESDFNVADADLSAYLTYTYEGDGWGLTAGAGGSWEGHVEKVPGPDRKEQDFYQAGLNLTFGDFSVGGVFEYYNDVLDRTSSEGDAGAPIASDAWVAGLGAAYTIDAWTIGAQYSHLDANLEGEVSDYTQDRAVLIGAYNLGPGIVIDGEIAYTWTDSDPNDATNADGIEVDDYNALEIGIGTSLTF